MAQGTHPRSRGENETCAPERCPPYGSSPLTRGKHIMRRGWPTCPGITPRWAGCHPHAYRATIPRRTHPRSRREHTSNAIGIVRSAGSSLLTRGTLSPRQESEALLGIIPAHAGNTPSDLCKHHTAQADYGSTVERLSLSYSLLSHSHNQGRTTRKSSQTQIRAATSTSNIQPMKAASATLSKLVPRTLVPSDHPGI